MTVARAGVRLRQPLLFANRPRKRWSGQHVKSVLRIEVEEGPVPTLSFETDQAALSRLIDKHLGKTILFTDNEDWTSEEIVLGYRSQHHIEDAFRQMKHPHYLGWQPMYHWTDSKIRVHAFICVLALTLSSLLQRTLYQKGLDVSLPDVRTPGRYPRNAGDLPEKAGSASSQHRPLPFNPQP